MTPEKVWYMVFFQNTCRCIKNGQQLMLLTEINRFALSKTENIWCGLGGA